MRDLTFEGSDSGVEEVRLRPSVACPIRFEIFVVEFVGVVMPASPLAGRFLSVEELVCPY